MTAPAAAGSRTGRLMAVTALALAAALTGLAVAAPIIAPYDPLTMHPAARFAAPAHSHLLGTDQFGRDILSRLVYGSRVSLGVAFASVAVSLAVGVLLGSLAAMRGGLTEGLIMRSMDVLLAFPAVLLAIALMAVRGTSLTTVILAIALVNTPVFVRTVRAAVLGTRHLEFVTAVRALGRSEIVTFAWHILPNAAAPIVVQATLSLSAAILVEAALSFLGLGTQPPAPSWGGMLAESRAFMELAPWTAVFPGLAIMLAVLVFNMLGDGIRDFLDPRLRSS
jgi:peptide/nickel transport system permease protein